MFVGAAGGVGVALRVVVIGRGHGLDLVGCFVFSV